MDAWGTLLLLWVIAGTLLLAAYRRPLLALWREPVLKHPVLILESDDWGAGLAAQAQALRRLAAILGAVRDATGRPTVMTLGLVLGTVDRQIWREGRRYEKITLIASDQAAILAVLREGVANKVFAPQWHGLEHYWPDSLIAVAEKNIAVAEWLVKDDSTTEQLPDALQSRWVDGGRLPTTPLPVAAIEAAVEEEAVLYRKLFGAVPIVAVPNTFVWSDDVERAWQAQGVRWVITCGARYSGRDADGRLVADKRGIVNGEISPTGVRYLMRDVYFEPACGHTQETLLTGLAAKTRLARPCLVESHRFNYLGVKGDASLTALAETLEAARSAFPNVRFIASAELAEAMEKNDKTLIATGLPSRFRAWVMRVETLPRFSTLAMILGLRLFFASVVLLMPRKSA